jgi:hypothetical protein
MNPYFYILQSPVPFISVLPQQSRFCEFSRVLSLCSAEFGSGCQMSRIFQALKIPYLCLYLRTLWLSHNGRKYLQSRTAFSQPLIGKVYFFYLQYLRSSPKNLERWDIYNHTVSEWTNGTIEGNGIWKSEGVVRRFKTAQYISHCSNIAICYCAFSIAWRVKKFGFFFHPHAPPPKCC